MCNKAPGPRCAGHTGVQLTVKKEALDKKSDLLNMAEANLIVAQKNNNSRSVKKFANEVKRLKTSVKKLEIEVTHIQREYDGTPRGKDELETRIKNCDSSEYPLLNDRLIKGQAQRSWRNNALQNSEARNIKEKWASAMRGLPEGSFSDERVLV